MGVTSILAESSLTHSRTERPFFGQSRCAETAGTVPAVAGAVVDTEKVDTETQKQEEEDEEGGGKEGKD
jgi:hypothetical protein